MDWRKLCKLFLICALLTAAAAAALPPEALADGRVLLKEVVLARHGVRSPLEKPAVLAEWTAKKWPAWPVKPGELTARGAALVFQQWGAERARLLAQGVQPAEIFICADATQRTVQTAEAMLAALAGSQDMAPVVYDRIFVTPVFHPVRAGLTSFDKTAAYNDIVRNAGGSLATLTQELSGPLSQLAYLCGPITAEAAQKYNLPQGANLLAIPSEVVFAEDGASVGINGGLGIASSAAEIFLLEYCQWPDQNAGWGAVNGEVLENLMQVHSDIFDVVNRANGVALPKASQLTALLASALLGRDLGLAKVAPAIKAPAQAAKVSIFVGHDTNIAGVAALLGLNWRLPGFAQNQIPPGSCLVLQLWRDGAKNYVTAAFEGLSLAAFHNNIALPDSVNRVNIPLAHMQTKQGGPAGQCSPDELAAWVTNHTKPAR